MIKNDKELSLLSILMLLKGMLRKLSTFKLLKVLWRLLKVMLRLSTLGQRRFSIIYLEAVEGDVEVVVRELN